MRTTLIVQTLCHRIVTVAVRPEGPSGARLRWIAPHERSRTSRRSRPRASGSTGCAPLPRSCRACELWEPATQTVFGEGPETARIVLVGEQPGDQEDRTGEPFVGPAGKLLDRALADAGIDRRDAYVTNAVKHFRFTPTGKRRIHQTPGPEHLRACRPVARGGVRGAQARDRRLPRAPPRRRR